MTTFKKRLLVTAVIAVLAVIGSLMNSQRAVAQNQQGETVTINPAQLPLPVKGSLGVSGTVAATQSGSWNVGITGIPLFKNVDEPGRSPFLSGIAGGGGFCSAAVCEFGQQFSGPGPNTRLVVKDVSVRVLLNPGGKIAYAQLFSCSTPNTVCTPTSLTNAVYIPLSLQASSVQTGTGLFDVWVANQQVDFYVEAGSVPEIFFFMDSGETSGLANTLGSVSGYTISLP